MMSFGMTAFVSIFLHMVPMTSGALWSIYKNGGVTMNQTITPKKGEHHDRIRSQKTNSRDR
jgi:hypothetical protein